MHVVGPANSWRLIHDGTAFIDCFEASGYTQSIHTIYEAPTQLECGSEAMRLGLTGIPEWLSAATPNSVTMRQARLALLSAGLLDDVDVALAAIPDVTQRRAAQIEWEYAATVDRGSAWVANLSSALGLTDGQLDALFVTAAWL